MKIRRLTTLMFLAAGALLASPPVPHHGGHVALAGGRVFEVVFDDRGLHVLPRNPLPTDVSLTAKVTLRARRQKPVVAPLEVVRGQDGRVDHLMLTRDFSKVPDGSRKATIRIEGLGPGPAEISLVLRRPPPGASPMAGSHGKAGSGKAGSDASMAGSHSDHDHSDHDEHPRKRIQELRRKVEARSGN